MEKNNTYEHYLQQNAKIINNVLGIPILVSVLVGPLCALMKLAGIFSSMTYRSCLIAAVLSLAAAGIHYLLVKFGKDSRTTAYAILTLLEIIIVYMRYANFNVSVALCIVPMLSLLYCERKTYYIASLIGLIGLILGMFLSKEHWGEILNSEDILVVTELRQAVVGDINGRLGEYNRRSQLEILCGKPLRVITVDYSEAGEPCYVQR